MYKIFDTKEEAEQAVAEYEIDLQPKFCPLLKNTCRTDCECWSRSVITLRQSGVFGTFFSGCTNAMFSPERDCNNSY